MGRRAKEDLQVSLFPFMSILACLIGILTLMIAVSMAVNQKKEGMAEEDLKRAQENHRIQVDISKKLKAIEEIQKRIAKENSTYIEKKKLEELLANLKDDLAKLESIPLDSTEGLQKEITALEAQTLSLQEEHPNLQNKIKKLEAQLAKLKNQPKPVESVVIKPPPLGSNVPRELFFVECNSTGIVLRGPKDSETIISTAGIKDSPEFLAFCEKVNKARDSAILFLIRKDGLDAYNWAAGLAENNFKLRTSKLPVPNEGKIDLSLFRLR